MKYIKKFEKHNNTKFWVIDTNYLKLSLSKIDNMNQKTINYFYDIFTYHQKLENNKVIIIKSNEESYNSGWLWSQYNNFNLYKKLYKYMGEITIKDYEKNAHKYNL